MSYQALLFCPDDKTARVVTQVLAELDFTVEPCNEPFAAVKKLMAQHFDALVVDCDNEQNATLLFKSARNSGSNQTSLAVAVVEGQSGVAKAFRIGANLVLTKPINVEQSKGTLRVARGLLRKADSAKPAGSDRPAAKSTSFPAFTPAPKPPSTPVTPTTAGAAFELENEPTPEPGPAEAALLETMKDSLPGSNSSTPAPATRGLSKEYPWQPVSKPLSEPMASALKRAAEAAGRVSPDASAEIEAAESQAADTYKLKESWPSSAALSPTAGAASAPAPAKESPRPIKPFEPKSAQPKSVAPKPIEFKPVQHKPLEHKTAAPAPKKFDEEFTDAPSQDVAIMDDSVLEPPSFGGLGDSEASEGGGSKKIVLIAVVLILAAGGYFGWTKMHSTSAPAPLQNQVAPAPAPVPAQTPASESVANPAAPSQNSTDRDHISQEIELSTAPSNAKPSPSKSGVPAASESSVKPVASEKTPPEPIIVRNESGASAHKSATAETVQAPSSEALGVTSNSDKALSGIASSVPVNVPKPAPQMLRVSQGVSQGLVIKRVQPIYPDHAKQMRIQGPVLIEAVIGKDGSIANVKSLSGDATLARAAMDAVRQWKYKPYYLNGEPVEIQTQITVMFKLP